MVFNIFTANSVPMLSFSGLTPVSSTGQAPNPDSFSGFPDRVGE